jgi:polar amino acid transport system substrate-binding protein
VTGGPPRARRPGPALAVLVALLAGGCSSGGGTASSPPSSPATASAALPTSAAASAAACGDPATSYAPPAQMPPPGGMPPGSTMARIAARGRLVVGTAGDKPIMAARDPRTAELTGIDVDLAKEVARAIFGSPDRVEFRTITYAARETALTSGQVDLVAHSMTMTCDRWQRVSFSTEYFRDGQRIMVRSDSTVREAEGLAGQRVCVARGTTTIDNLRAFRGVQVVPVDDAADCLVLFQRGEVDAVTSNDVVLRGYVAQDPYAKIVGRPLSDEPRGLAFRKEDVDLVRFVNGVLEQLRRNGGLERILAAHLRPVGLTVVVQAPRYGR